MKFLEKLREKPLWARKMILWTVVGVAAVILVFLWLKGSYLKLKNMQMENFIEKLNVPDFEAQLPDFPDLEIPSPSATSN